MCISMVKQQRNALVQREAILLPLKENLQKKKIFLTDPMFGLTVYIVPFKDIENLLLIQ